MQGDPSKLHLPRPHTSQTLCGLERDDTQWCEVWPQVAMPQFDQTRCKFCAGLAQPATGYRRVDFRVGGETGAYVTVYQRVGEKPLLDLNFFDGDRSMDEAALRVRALLSAWELAAAWHVETRPTSSTGQSAAL